MKTIDQMLIFDVDGVITNPQKKKITEPEILDEIVKRLKRNEPVALITGRAREWIIDRVVSKIENRIADKNILNDVFVSNEFGGTSSIYEKGIRKDSVNKHFLINEELLVAINKIVDDKFSDSMFVDLDKKTMISIEMRDNLSLEKFKLVQNKLVEEIRKIVSLFDKKYELEIHVDIIATNIRYKKANKRYATEQMLNWLSNKKICPQKYFVFGDTKGDKDIAKELSENKLPVVFVFVGKKDELGDEKLYFKTIITLNKYEKGTLEFLKNLND
jgi:hypothetical protein